MKNQKKWFKTLVLGLVLLGVIFIGVGSSLYLVKNKPKDIKTEYENSQQQEKDNNEEINIDNTATEEQIDETNIDKPEDSKPQEEIKQNQVETQNKNESSNNTETKPKEESPQVQKPVQETPVVEQPKPKTPWEELGISEYDYYNKPEISWQTVDFSIEQYGSQANARQACIDAGSNNNELERYTFRCDETYSYSHKFLGYHIKYTIVP